MREEGGMNLFIDTCVLLDFYRFPKDDLKILQRIVASSKTKYIRLYISDYLEDEFYRNREGVIKKSIDEFCAYKTSRSIPFIFQSLDKYTDLIKLLRELDKIQSSLRRAVVEAAHNYKLYADIVITDLFNSAHKEQVTERIKRKGINRLHHSQPPGKNGKCGDAVHWEWLLSSVPDKENLVIVSYDRDFQSHIDDNRLSAYLYNEWKLKKSSNCKLYTSLNTFLNDNFPDIKLSKPALKAELPSFHQNLNQIENSFSLNPLSGQLLEFRRACESTYSNPILSIIASLQAPVTPFQEALEKYAKANKSLFDECIAVTNQHHNLADNKVSNTKKDIISNKQKK